MCSAVEVLRSPELEGASHTGHAVFVAFLLAVPAMAGLLVEARLLLWARKIGRRRAIALSLVGIGLALGLASVWPLLLPMALIIAMPLQGVVGGAGQAGVVAAHGDAEAAMARWASFAAVGDLLGPMLCGAVALLGGGWRATFVACAAWMFVHAAAVQAGEEVGADGEDEDEEEEGPDGVLALIRQTLADRPLLGALSVAAMCTLLDEILIVFGALWLDSRGVSVAERDFTFGAFAAGLTVGSFLVEPLLRRFSSRTVLAASSLGCGLLYAVWLAWPVPVLLGLAGFASAPMYPLAEARAYAAAPPDRVAAASRLVGVVEVLAPIAVGLVADHFGLRAAMVLLGLEPLVLFFAAMRR